MWSEEGLEARHHLRIDSLIVAAQPAQQDESAYQVGMPYSEVRCGCGPHAVADAVGAVNTKVPQEAGRIVGQLLVAQRAIDVRGAPVRLCVHREDLAGPRKDWQERPEHLKGAH